jgi:hypothetical protein
MDWGFIGVILAIIFGITTLFLSIFAIRRSRQKKPVWAYVSRQIIEIGKNAPREIKLFFNDEPVNNVYRTYVIFFNAGN